MTVKINNKNIRIAVRLSSYPTITLTSSKPDRLHNIVSAKKKMGYMTWQKFVHPNWPVYGA